MEIEKLISEAQSVLQDLGMDSERSNRRSALVLLSLASIDDSNSWEDCSQNMLTTREIMDWIRDHLFQDYAANTRETIRRFTLHQFIAGGIVEYNADNPNRATNSPHNNYRLRIEVVELLRLVGRRDYQKKLENLLLRTVSWQQQVSENRGMNKVPVSLPNGEKLTLSAGGQNLLIKAMVEEFCPRFTPGGLVLYIDDTDHKHGTVGDVLLEKFNIRIPEHGKAPDLIVWQPEKEWLFLMEACSTHGPIDVIRKRDLHKLFDDAKGHIVFVSCFPDRATMRKYLADLAWETEAWCADTPDHMIHLNGTRFMGPYQD